jgi:hypothetical protein
MIRPVSRCDHATVHTAGLRSDPRFRRDLVVTVTFRPATGIRQPDDGAPPMHGSAGRMP